MDFNKVRGMMNSFAALYCEIFRDDAFLYKKMTEITEYMMITEMQFIENKIQYPLYYIKFLYAIDQGIERYLMAARRRLLNTKEL